MKDNQAKYPQLRFKGCTDPWEERKLTDITSSYSGLTYSPTDVQDKGTFVLRSSNVKNDQLVDADNVYVNPDIVNSNNVKVGDVIVVVRNGSRSLIGKHAIIIKEMPNTVIGAFMSAFRGQNGDYINALLSTNNFQKEVHKSLGATINQITGKDFSMMNFLTPKLEEQSKIGSFFKQLDDTIALHQRKLGLYKKLKKGYLQKMFPKNGAKVPELRFAGFADAWEQRKVSELADRYDNLRVPITASERVAGETPYYGANGIQDYVESFTHNGEFVLVAEDGANDLQNYPVQYVDGKVWVNNHAHVLQAKEERVDNKFLTNALKHTNIEPYLVGGGRAKLNADVMMKINFKVPTLPEQVQIGKFFDNLDHLITLHQRKLEKLQELKKGYLQKMFC
ncbi:restriction endonuclease subunit S [Levilactobacillus lettrarii]|uniref:restriction endonuclease subunit S n=1 Tax=Levilactobacillus lettrarii TaxID=3242689 RepID=UPI0037570FCB